VQKFAIFLYYKVSRVDCIKILTTLSCVKFRHIETNYSKF